jgi:hypothetical protein
MSMQYLTARQYTACIKLKLPRTTIKLISYAGAVNRRLLSVIRELDCDDSI